MQVVGVRQSVKGKNQISVVKHRPKPPPPFSIPQRTVCLSVHSDIRVERLDISDDVDKFGVGAQITKVTRKRDTLQLRNKCLGQALDICQCDIMIPVFSNFLPATAEGTPGSAPGRNLYIDSANVFNFQHGCFLSAISYKL
jgi:hypothetical protein